MHYLLVFYLIFFFFLCDGPRDTHSFPTRRSSDLALRQKLLTGGDFAAIKGYVPESTAHLLQREWQHGRAPRSEEHTSELQSRENLVCRLLLEKKKNRRHRRRDP